MSFRLARLVIEVRNGSAPMPTLAQHVGFAFFVPTFAVGPISPYAAFAQSLTGATNNMRTLTERLNRGEGTAGKLMTDPALFNQLKSLADRLDLLTKSLNDGEGTVVSEHLPPEIDTPQERRRLGEELLDGLVQLHSVDWEAAGITIGKPTG